MGGDKIVLLDGAGANGGGAATNGLLSMIPGMFANLIGGNKMDPNLVAALMNGRNNQDGFGGANGWWLWIALPCEGLILLKIRQVVPTAGSALPVQIAVPANSTVSTVGADTCCPVTGVNVVNPINVAVTGAAMVNGTERLLYFNKVRGVLRLMDCCVPTTTAQAYEVKAGK